MFLENIWRCWLAIGAGGTGAGLGGLCDREEVNLINL